jgi:hypothetical protein
MPLASHNPVPQVVLQLNGPGFEDYRPHLLEYYLEMDKGDLLPGLSLNPAI